MAAPDRIRVLIVDDSALVRLLLSQIIAQDPELELAGAEMSGQAALDKLATLRPDVVVLDVEMPGLSGVETVAAMRGRYPRLPVIMFSAHTAEGAAVTIEALSRGAADYVTKPAQMADAATALATVRAQLLPKIKGLGQMRRKPIPPASDASPANDSAGGGSLVRPVVELVCMASSTGGPNALEVVLAALPASFPVPIVLVQHMPPLFTRQLADRLATKCAIRVREAEAGEMLTPGTVLIAPGDYHLVVRRRSRDPFVITSQAPPENSCRPAADVLFRSAAEIFGAQALGVVLTGMGQDGLVGCQAIRAAGGRVVVQDEETSVVWGMPGAVFRAGLASKALPIDKIAAEIVRRVLAGRA